VRPGLLVFLLAACGSAPALPPPDPALEPLSAPWGVLAARDLPTTFVVRTPGGPLLVNPPTDPVATLRLTEAARALAGGVVAGVVVLDADPARADALQALQARGFRLHAAPPVARHLAVPTEPLPGLTAAGAARTAQDAWLDAGGASFPGDLVTPGRHPDLRRADPQAWLAALDALAARPTASLPAGAVDVQRRYLRLLLEAIRDARDPPEQAAHRIHAEMVAAFPDLADRTLLAHALPTLLRPVAPDAR
jgi:hypothetical protein